MLFFQFRYANEIKQNKSLDCYINLYLLEKWKNYLNIGVLGVFCSNMTKMSLSADRMGVFIVLHFYFFICGILLDFQEVGMKIRMNFWCRKKMTIFF